MKTTCGNCDGIGRTGSCWGEDTIKCIYCHGSGLGARPVLCEHCDSAAEVFVDASPLDSDPRFLCDAHFQSEIRGEGAE